MSFPDGSEVKNPPASTEDMGLIGRLGRSAGVGNGNPLQYPCLENPMDRGAWWATVHGVTKGSDASERLNSNNKATEQLCSQETLSAGAGEPGGQSDTTEATRQQQCIRNDEILHRSGN